MDGEEQTQKTKQEKRKAQSIPARKRKPGGHVLEEEEEEDVSEKSGGSSSEEDTRLQSREKILGQRLRGKRRRMNSGPAFSTMWDQSQKCPKSTS